MSIDSNFEPKPPWVERAIRFLLGFCIGCGLAVLSGRVWFRFARLPWLMVAIPIAAGLLSGFVAATRGERIRVWLRDLFKDVK